MESVTGGPILQFLSRLAEILQDLAVEEFNLARRIQGTHKPRNCVDDPAETFLILCRQSLFGDMSCGCHRAIIGNIMGPRQKRAIPS